MTALTKDPQKTPAQVRKWRDGVKYQCILSKSPGYKAGQIYTAYKNASGIICLRGSDGYEDMCSMLVSGFKEVDKATLTVVE